MRQSRPITAGGRFVGVAAAGDRGWFLIALDPRLQAIDRTDFRDAAEVERVAASVLARHAARRRPHAVSADAAGG